MKSLDCRGLACPQPVINTKDALEEVPAGQVTVLVDNQAARDNVTRFAQSQGHTVSVTDQGNDFLLTITKAGTVRETPGPETSTNSTPGPAAPRLVVKVGSGIMGSGSEQLGRILMNAFLKSLSETTLLPETILFYNTGVYLTCEGSEQLETLRHLENLGVNILSCGTCLDFFNKKEELAVGAVSNMFEIIETLSGADRVVSP